MWRPTVAYIDLSAIEDNVRAIRARVGPNVKIMPAVKANGYGHGAVQVSRACLNAGADALGVSCIEEAAELRESGIEAPILILGCSNYPTAKPVLDYNIACTVCDMSFARVLSDKALENGRVASVHVKVDTGMGRIGVPVAEAIKFIQELLALPGLSVDGLFTHFPSADEADRSYTLNQIEVFRNLIGELQKKSISFKMIHASNSGGVLSYPTADFDAVRPGIMMYGIYPSSDTPQNIPLRQALTLKTQIVFIKTAPKGATISYGRTHTLIRDSVVATIPIGYADGYPRALSNCGEASVNGVRVPIIGRVCMDQCLIDVTDIPGVKVDDEVVLYGGGYEFLNIRHIADRIDTVPHDLTCAITSRVKRVYM